MSFQLDSQSLKWPIREDYCVVLVSNHAAKLMLWLFQFCIMPVYGGWGQAKLVGSSHAIADEC